MLSRADVRYVVTEYGVADLFGKSVRERVLALCEIAHPDFRNEILSEARNRHYIFPDQKELPVSVTRLNMRRAGFWKTGLSFFSGL
jgi:acyl-CoA hydrolase